MQYLQRINAVSHNLGLPIVLSLQNMVVSTAVSTYLHKASEIEAYIIHVKIKHGRRKRGYHVALNPTTKETVRHLIAQIRSIVDRLEVNVQKKEALYARITALSDEIDRDRTRYDAYAALAIEMSNTTGKVYRNLRPAGGLLDRIGKFFGMAKEAEASKPQLQLEAPRLQLAPPNEADATPEADTGAAEQD